VYTTTVLPAKRHTRRTPPDSADGSLPFTTEDHILIVIIVLVVLMLRRR